MRRTALLALLPALLTLSTAARADNALPDRQGGTNVYTADYRSGEDWNDFAARKGWWGRGDSAKVAPAAFTPVRQAQEVADSPDHREPERSR